jgi:hypothetical protein
VAARRRHFVALRQPAHHRHALDQPRIIAHQLVERHPEAAALLRLRGVGADAHLAPALAAGRQRGQPDLRAFQIVAGVEAVAVAGVLAGARIGRAQQRQQGRRRQQRRPAQVVALDVADLVADVEVDRVRALFQRIDHVRIQHDEIVAEEAGGKGVEGAAHLQQVGFRHHRQPEALAAHLDALVQVGNWAGVICTAVPRR